MYYLIPLVVIFIRLSVPFLILKKPFWGVILAIIADASDVIILDAFGWGFLAGKDYHLFDKFFDTYYLAFAFYVSLKWQEMIVRKTSIFLFVWRLLGVIVFEFIHIRQLMFFAPNIFENFYILIAGIKEFFPKFKVDTIKRLTIILLIAAIPKIIQEYIMHFLEFPTWMFIKHNIFRWY